MKDKISITINEKILRDIDSVVDNILIRNRSQAIEYLIEEALKGKKIAVILVGDSAKLSSSARMANRYAIKIDGISLIERAVRKLSNSGFKTVYIIGIREILANIFKIIGEGSEFNVKIGYVIEETQNGTASAIKLLKGKINSTFLLIHSDILIDHINLASIWKKHLQDKVVVTFLIGSPYNPGDNSIHGNVYLEGDRIIKYVEKPNKKDLKSSMFGRGVFVMEPEILSYPGNSLEFDVFPMLMKKGLIGGYTSATEHLHIHTRKDIEAVRKKFKEIVNGK